MLFFVFDWDNTLMPSIHWEDSGRTGCYPTISKSIVELITLAQTLGKVYIVTNASGGWVEKCLDEAVPGCAHLIRSLIRSLSLISTVDSGISTKHPFHLWKTIAFVSLWESLPQDEEHHMISFGDCVHDRDAALHIKDIYSDSTVKNIKFVVDPTGEQIHRQHKLLVNTLRRIVDHGDHLDLKLNINTIEGSIDKSVRKVSEDVEASEYELNNEK